MADDKISVSFSADTSELTTAIGLAKAQLAAFSAEVNNFAGQSTTSARVANDTLRSALESAGAGATNLKSAVAGADAALASAATTAGHAASAFGSAGLTASYLTRETRALLDEASSNRWRQFDGTVVNLGFHILQAGAGFLAANPTIAAAGVAAAAAAASFGYLAFEMSAANSISASLKNSLAFSGQVGLSDKDIAEVASRIDKLRGLLSGLGKGDADTIAENFRKIPALTREMADAVISDLQPLADALRIKLPEAAKILQQGLESPKEGLKSLADLFGNDLTPAIRDEIKAAQDSLDPHVQQAAFLNAIAEALNRVKDLRLQEIDGLIAQRNAQMALNDEQVKSGGATAGAALESNRQIKQIIDGLEEERRKIEAAKAASLDHAKAVGQISSSVDELRSKFDDLLKSVAPWSGELERAQEAVKKLTEGLGAMGAGGTSSAAAAAILGQESGNRDHPGTSVTGAIGPGQVEPDTFKQFARPGEDINNPTDNRAVAERIVDSYWKQFNGDITRVAVAYFSGKGNVAPAGSATPYLKDKTDPTGKSTSSYVSDVQSRFQQIQQGTEALNQQLDKENAIKAAEAGGTAIEKEKLATLQADVISRKDDIAAAERLVAATKAQLKEAHSLTEQRKLQSDLASAEGSLKDRQNASQEAQLRLGVGEAQGKGDAAGTRDAEVADATFWMSLYGQDTAEYKAALGEKEAAIRQFANTEKQVAMEGAQAEINSVESATQAKIRDLDMEAKAHVITEQQKVSATEAALANEIAKERDILNAELALDNLRPPERKRILDELAQLEQNYAQQVKQVQTQAADDAAKSWQGVASTIEGAVNSQFKSVLSGAESFRTGMAKVAEDIAMKFLEKGEQIVMNWLADQAAMKTATNLGDLGSALTSVVANALKGISAGAGETAAGVSGFLAPVIGPAAVPAGIAAGTAIASAARGIGMMDIGAWNIPTDQLAMIHKNELVMPAPEAAQFRANLSAQAAGGGGGGAGDTHHNTWNISGAQSPIDVARQVARYWNANPSVRPRY